MTSAASYIVYLLFALLFSSGCIALGYVIFGKILDKMTRRSEFIAIDGQISTSSELSEYMHNGIERLPAPNLQTFEALLITMETLNSCLEDVTSDIINKTDSTEKLLKREK